MYMSIRRSSLQWPLAAVTHFTLKDAPKALCPAPLETVLSDISRDFENHITHLAMALQHALEWKDRCLAVLAAFTPCTRNLAGMVDVFQVANPIAEFINPVVKKLPLAGDPCYLIFADIQFLGTVLRGRPLTNFASSLPGLICLPRRDARALEAFLPHESGLDAHARMSERCQRTKKTDDQSLTESKPEEAEG
jgi:hypothetical protein